MMSKAAALLTKTRSVQEVYVSNKSRVDRKSIEELFEKNKDRIGDTVIALKGNEIPNSTVLTAYSFAIKDKDRIVIESYSPVDDSSSSVTITFAELALLKKRY